MHHYNNHTSNISILKYVTDLQLTVLKLWHTKQTSNFTLVFKARVVRNLAFPQSLYTQET